MTEATEIIKEQKGLLFALINHQEQLDTGNGIDLFDNQGDGDDGLSFLGENDQGMFEFVFLVCNCVGEIEEDSNTNVQ